MRRALALALALVASASPVATAAPSIRHLIYLHGRIVQEQQSARPHHPQWGYYELEAILDAFRARGFVVSGEIRPKAISIDEAADHVVAQVRRLRASGVPADRITIVGGSMGASIAFLAATRLHDHRLRFAVLGACLSENVRALAAEEGRSPAGRVLAIRDRSDDLTEPCPAWTDGKGGAGGQRADVGPGGGNGAAAAPTLVAREIVLDTGLGHGFLYRPLPDWVGPVTAWAEGADDEGAPPRGTPPAAKSGPDPTRPGA
jgi:pimeloyl-ACP methyl ester carboxylesterase